MFLNTRMSPVRLLLIGVLVSMVFSIGSSFLLGQYSPFHSLWVEIVVILLWICSFIIPALVTSVAIVLSFKAEYAIPTQLRVILVSYFGSILVFTGLYFSMSMIGDHDYAHTHYFYYSAYAGSFSREVAAQEVLVSPFAEDHKRAFVGIEARLWGTLEDVLPLASLDFQKNRQGYIVEMARQREFKDVVRFRPDAVAAVLLDCLHLSVMTIATVGYGNIAPSSWYAKLATDAEALIGTALLVIALTLLLSRNRPYEQTNHKNPVTPPDS